MSDVRARGRGGIKASVLKKARISELPTTLGPCKVFGCFEKSAVSANVRYFVAAKLPTPIYLCDRHYIRIRDTLEEKLAEILRDAGL